MFKWLVLLALLIVCDAFLWATNSTDDSEEGAEDTVTPWMVKSASEKGFDFMKIMNKIGSKMIDSSLIERIKSATGKEPHFMLRRGDVFSHRDLEIILEKYEQRQPFYLYTEFRPSEGALHVGHLIQLNFTKWLQKAFKVPLIVQLNDGETDQWKNKNINQAISRTHDMAKDIIAAGVDKDRTLLFNDIEFSTQSLPFFENIRRILGDTTFDQLKSSFNFKDSDSVANLSFPAFQAAATFSSSFPVIFNNKKDLPCLVVCSIDQDAFFQFARNVASRVEELKPAVLHSKFLPALQDARSKMSSNFPNSAIFLNDTVAEIERKIEIMASTIGSTNEQVPTVPNRRKRCNSDIEAERFYPFLSSVLHDEQLAKLREDYNSGNIVREKLTQVLGSFVKTIVEDQTKFRNEVTDDDVKKLMTLRPLL